MTDYSKGKIIITYEQYDKLQTIQARAKALLDMPEFKALLNQMEGEYLRGKLSNEGQQSVQLILVQIRLLQLSLGINDDNHGVSEMIQEEVEVPLGVYEPNQERESSLIRELESREGNTPQWHWVPKEGDLAGYWVDTQTGKTRSERDHGWYIKQTPESKPLHWR
jgi:hypothetical protein